MTDPNKTPTPAEQAAAATPTAGMTVEQAAKRVRRPVTQLVDGKDEDGKPVKVARTTFVAVKAEEVLDFKDYGTHVVVVTEDGQKLSSLDAEEVAGAKGAGKASK